MRLRALLEAPGLGLELLHGQAELDRPIRSVMTTDLSDPSRYLTGGELVLTGMVWRREPTDSKQFVSILTSSGVAALAAGDSETGLIPADLVDACRAAGLPLLRVPAEVAFAAVTEQVVRRLSGVMATDVTAFLGRHRDLMAAGSNGLAAVLDLVRDQLSMRCWVMTATGRIVAGPDEVPIEKEISKALNHYLSGQRIPCLPHGGQLSVVGIGDAAGPRLANWLLLCDSDVGDWEVEQHRLVRELAAVIETERSRLEHHRAHRRSAADGLAKMIAADVEPGELAHQMRLADLPTEGEFVAVAASMPGQAELARSIMEDLLDLPAAVLDDLVLAIVPARTVDVSRARVLAPALDRCPLRIGVSGPAIGVPGLRGALDEARHACTLGTMSPERVAIVGHDDLGSHMMLLAAIPDDVRRAYRQRLLGPVAEYDRQHRADLIPTLHTFLAHSGSWTKCAEVLHVHVNTLRYRIQRIEQMTGRDLGKLEHRVDLFLALVLAGKC